MLVIHPLVSKHDLVYLKINGKYSKAVIERLSKIDTDPTSQKGVVESKSSQNVAIGKKISCEKVQTVCK